MKRILLTASIMIFMVFAVSSATDNTYAYWANTVSSPISDTTSGTVAIGSWSQIFQWEPNTTYQKGDQVINNGTIYTAKRNNPKKEPGVSRHWKRQWRAE